MADIAQFVLKTSYGGPEVLAKYNTKYWPVIDIAKIVYKIYHGPSGCVAQIKQTIWPCG